MIKILLLSNVFGQVVGDITPELKKELVKNCSYEVQGAFFAQQCTGWDGRKVLITDKLNKFPLGLFARVRYTLNALKIPFEIEDLRENPNLPILPVELKNIQLRKYQEEGIRVARMRNRGIIKVATGGGKSLLAAGLVKSFPEDTIVNIFVHRNTLVRQLEKTFKDVGIKGVGVIGDGIKSPNRVTICSVASMIHKKEEDDVMKFCEINKSIMEEAQVMIIDEAHHTPASSFQIVSQYSKNAYYRYGFTATPFREDNADILIEAATGRLILDLGASVLIRENWLVKPKIYFINIPAVNGLTKKEGYASVYQQGITENDIRNEMIADVVKACYAKGKTCLVAVSKIKHGEILLEKITKRIPEKKVMFIQGTGTSGEEKMQTLEGLHKRKLMCVIATTVFGEGVDVQSLDVLINTKAAKSAIDTLQLCGRVLRPYENKTHATIIDFFDKTTPYLHQHALQRIKILESEPEFAIQRVDYMLEVTL